MYKSYPKDDYYRVADSCADNLRRLLNDQLKYLEERRDEINDRYPFEDLFLQQAAVDYEKEMIYEQLQNVDKTVVKIKHRIDTLFTINNEGEIEHTQINQKSFSDIALSAPGYDAPKPNFDGGWAGKSSESIPSVAELSNELYSKTFPIRRKGYNAFDVQEFMKEIANDLVNKTIDIRTIETIESVEFAIVNGGYDMNFVDGFLDGICDELEKIININNHSSKSNLMPQRQFGNYGTYKYDPQRKNKPDEI